MTDHALGQALNNTSLLAREFEDATAATARTLSRDHKIDVLFMGDKAKTNGHAIVLPKMADDKVLTKEQVEVARGYVDHEIGHKLLTDFTAGEKMQAEAKKTGNRMWFQTANAMEDVRIERGLNELYPGMRAHIEQTARKVNEAFLENPEAVEACKDFKKIGPIAITWEGRRRMGYLGTRAEECLDMLPQDIRDKVNQFVDVLMSVPTGCESGVVSKTDAYAGCRDVISLAKKFASEIGEPNEDDEDDSKGADGKGDPAGGVGGSEEWIETEDNIVDPSFSTAVEGIWERGAGTTPYMPLTTAWDKVHTRHDDTKKYGKPSNSKGSTLRNSEGLSRYLNIMTKGSSHLGAMRRKLERALSVFESTEYESGFTSGKFNVKRLVDAVNLRNGIYKRKTEGKTIDTAITVLIDLSGSMSGSKLDLAQKAAIAIAEALRNTSVPIEVLGFSCATGYNGMGLPEAVMHHIQQYETGGYRSRGEFHDYARSQPNDLWVFKDFNEKLNDARIAMGNIYLAGGGNNCDGEAVLAAYDRLSKRQERKKILLVLSDGWPAFSGGSDGYEHLSSVINYITTKGVECVGIGIKDEAVKRFYPKWQVLHDISDLPKAVLDNIARMLLGQNFKVDNADLIKSAPLKRAA